MPDVDPRSPFRYWQLSVTSRPESSGSLTQLFRKLGSVGVMEHEGSLYAFFEEAMDRDHLFAEVRGHVNQMALTGVQVQGKIRISLLDGEWAEMWPEFFVPVAVGRRLIVAPPWITPAASDRLIILIDPGRGFGTGHHPTTAGCLAMIENIVEREHPEMAIDLGTGSGLLGIAAARLGVAEVLAVDHEAEATASAHANATRNGVGDRMHCVVADAGAIETEPAPLVIANLLTAVHVELASRYPRLVTPGGIVVLAGILETEVSALSPTLAREGLVLREQLTIEQWTTLVLSR